MNSPESDAASSESTSTPILKSHRIWPYLVIFVVFLLLVVFTRSSFLNDTVFYAYEIESSLNCSSINECPQIWDAGHLLWRPLAHGLLPPLLPLLKPLVGDNVPVAVALLLVVLSGIAILIGAFLLYAVLIKNTENLLISLFLTTGFLCTSANLYALHSGTSYPAGLVCLIGGIWYVERGSQASQTRFLAIAGVCGGLAVAFWLPYIVALPALLCWALLNSRVRRLEVAILLILVTTLTGALLFSLGAHFRGIESIVDFRAWVVNSGHGTKQTHNLIRSLFGLPRAFLDLGHFGIRMKQFLFKDPYANVKLSELFVQTVWKIALFYVSLMSLIWLHRTAIGRKALTAFGIALVSNMGLALAFEGGSPERYFPLYPFLFIAAAYCLCLPQIPRIARISVSLLFLVMIMGNLPSASAKRIHAEQNLAARRLIPLLPVPPKSVLFVIGDDSIFRLRFDAPFHEINRRANFQIRGVYTPMMSSATWKHDFATKVLSTWEQGGNIWITTRVWSEQPRREWNWVEGDDPNVTWRGIIEFFRPLDHNSAAFSDDGFALLPRSTVNEAILKPYTK